jgi:hypothetical protein
MEDGDNESICYSNKVYILVKKKLRGSYYNSLKVQGILVHFTLKLLYVLRSTMVKYQWCIGIRVLLKKVTK